jgi:hypothetical protein
MNLLVSLFVILLGIYSIYTTYKKPSPLKSTNLKGYIGGIAFLYLGIMGFIGKIDVVQIIKDIFNL